MDRKMEPGTQTDKNVATQTKYAGSSATSEKSGYRWEKEDTIAEKRLFHNTFIVHIIQASR